MYARTLRYASVAAVLAATLTLPVLAQNANDNTNDNGNAARPKSVTIELKEQNGSDQEGKATLTEDGLSTKVVLTLEHEPAGASEPAHIHKGSCPAPGDVAYPLSDVVNGRSETIVAKPLTDLLKELPLAINVHKSATESASYVSCGNLKPLKLEGEKKQIDVACIQAAIDKREASLLASLDKRTAADKAALSARKDALKSAWALTDKKERRAELRKAWTGYRAALRSANRDFRNEKHDAWKAFTKDRKACGVNGATEDKTTEGVDAQL